MSNSSAIYATDMTSGPLGKRPFGDALHALGSHRGDFPIVYKLLLSGKPRLCKSFVYEARDLALLGDYDAGLARLTAFLNRIDIPQAEPAIRAALGFLNAPENKRQFFLLETADIVGMSDASPKQQNQALIDEINHLEPELERTLDAFNAWMMPVPAVAPSQPGFLARLFGAKAQPAPPPEEPDAMKFIDWMGLRSWAG